MCAAVGNGRRQCGVLVCHCEFVSLYVSQTKVFEENSKTKVPAEFGIDSNPEPTPPRSFIMDGNPFLRAFECPCGADGLALQQLVCKTCGLHDKVRGKALRCSFHTRLVGFCERRILLRIARELCATVVANPDAEASRIISVQKV